MNLDDLDKLFWGDTREQPTRVRLARVVKALRDEIASQFGFNERWNAAAVVGAFDEILGGDAEGAAGGPRQDNGRPLVKGADKEASQSAVPAADRLRSIVLPPAQDEPTTPPDPAMVCTWSHPKPGPEGQLIEYERSTCGKPKWRSFKFMDTKCQCGREVFVDYNDPANVMLLRPRS